MAQHQPCSAAAKLNSLGFAQKPEDTRVVVAMSGGVDSSVVAALLASEGYDVIGITLQLYDHGKAVHRKGACCAGQDIQDAKRVAETLGIPHYVLDYEKRFAKEVIEDFADSYLAGETPIPCVKCNQDIKFKDLAATALDLGAQVLATGHYVDSRSGTHGREMFRARDHERDQSYFLFATTQEQLDFLRFPLGGLTKAETRNLAKEFGLKIANKPDSQDICFVQTGNYAQVIEKLRPGASEQGDIVHIDGQVLGTHNGIIHYTVGQRRGIGVAVGSPLYVVRLDAEAKQVIVGPKTALSTRKIHLRDVNWLGRHSLSSLPEAGRAVFVKVRSTQQPQPAVIRALQRPGEGDEDRATELEVELPQGEDGIAPGQACVFFENDSAGARILGGGWVNAAYPN